MDDRTKADRRQGAAPARKKKHRLLKAFLATVLLAIGLVAALPWAFSTPSGRDFLVGKVNARLAPGSIRLGKLGLSWAGPITLGRVALIDPKGKTVLAADRVSLDRGILELLASRPDYGTVAIEGAAVDVERRIDGTVDLLDALATVLKADAPAPVPGQAPPAAASAASPAAAPLAVTVVVKGGTLKLASPELVEPLAAKTLEGSLTIAPGQPMAVVATLGDEGRSLDVRSTVDPASPDRAASVVAKGWPIHARQVGVEVQGQLAGHLEAKQQGGGFWLIQGDATLAGFEAAGPALRGDRLALDRVAASCDVEQSTAGWVVRKLDLASPVASLQGVGTIPALADRPAQLRGKVDLAALAKVLPNAMRLRDGLTLDAGTANVRVDVTTVGGLDRLELAVSLDDFAATEGGRPVRLRQPVYLTGRASRSAGAIAVEGLEVKAAGVDATASGNLKAGVKLAGTVDLATLMGQLRDVLDLGRLDLAGRVRLAADYKHADDSYKGRFATEVKGLKVVGATAEPIERDLARLDGWAIGHARADGTPESWQQARLDLKAGDWKLDLQAHATPGEADLLAGFEMMVASPVPGRFDARAKFRKRGTLLDVDELTAGITPTDPGAAEGVVALAVKGEYDTASGAGAFGPIPGYAAGALGLGPDGAKVSGVGRSDLPLKVDASLAGDLAALDRLLASWGGSPPKGLAGAWASRVGLTRSKLGQVAIGANVNVPDLATSGTPRGPASLSLKAGYAPEADRVDLGELGLATRYGRVAFAGTLAEATGRRLVDLTGTLEPNWPAIDRIIDPAGGDSARVRARARPIRLAGPLKADTTPQLLDQLAGEVGLDVTEARAFGLTMGPAAVVLKFAEGRAKFDPIATTLNGGTVAIAADLTLDGDSGVWLRVGPSKVDGAAINEAVSDAILSYVAPVLSESSSVSGKVTVAVDRAFVPITAKDPLALDGSMAFQKVVFQPGTFASDLNALTGQAMKVIRLDESMVIKVANGRVYQHGLTIPVGGNGLKVAIDGSVGLDETLDLAATVPLTAKALGLDAIAGQSAGLAGAGTNVTLPIRGTLAKPAIDRKALGVALRDAAKAAGEKRLKSEAGRLLDRIAGPGQGSGEARSKPAGRNPLGDLEDLGRQILDPK